MAELPPIVGEAKYVAVFNAAGDLRALEIPTRRSVIFGADGAVVWEDGMSDGLLLDSIKKFEADSDNMRHLIAATAPGAWARWSPPDEDTIPRVPVFVAGIGEWRALPNTISTEGNGLMYRDAEETKILSGNGVVVQNDDGTLELVSSEVSGQILRRTSDGYAFADPSAGGASTSGGSSTGLAGVIGENISVHEVNYQAPTMTVTDNTGDEIRLQNVNITIDLAASGVGGLDTGAENSSRWYRAFVIYNPGDATIDGVLSESDAPDLSGLTGFTHWAFLGYVRNNASGDIVKFKQRGREFFTVPVEYVTGGSSTTSWNPIASGTNLNTIVPPSVRSCRGVVGGVGGGGGEGVFHKMFVAGSNDGIGMIAVGSFNLDTSTVEGFRMDCGSFDDLVIVDPSSPSIYWKSNTNSNKRRMLITGYNI